jgi:hypothetical protein
VINNHFNSKGGDQSLFGENQPPVRGSETERHTQANAVKALVESILALDPNANVVVLGDLNDFQFSETLNILKSAGLYSLTDELLPTEEQYTYIFNGTPSSWTTSWPAPPCKAPPKWISSTATASFSLKNVPLTTIQYWPNSAWGRLSLPLAALSSANTPKDPATTST